MLSPAHYLSVNSRDTVTTKPAIGFLLIQLSLPKKPDHRCVTFIPSAILLYQVICMQCDLSCFLNCVYLRFFPGDFIFLQEGSCAFLPQKHIKIRCDLFSQGRITSLLESRLLQLIHCIPGAIKKNGLAQENTYITE